MALVSRPWAVVLALTLTLVPSALGNSCAFENKTYAFDLDWTGKEVRSPAVVSTRRGVSRGGAHRQARERQSLCAAPLTCVCVPVHACIAVVNVTGDQKGDP